MDRVFEPVRPVVAITPPITPEQESLDRRPVWRSKAVLGVVLISSAAISLAALTALLMWRQWMETRQQLQQERQLQLLERLQPLPQQQLTPARTTPPAPSAPLPPIRVDVPEMFPAIAPPPPPPCRRRLRSHPQCPPAGSLPSAAWSLWPAPGAWTRSL